MAAILPGCAYKGSALDAPQPVAALAEAPNTDAVVASPQQTQFSAKQAAAQPITFSDDGRTNYGTWHADITVSTDSWNPGEQINLETTLTVPRAIIDGITHDAKGKVDQLVLLVTAERTFDNDGWLRLASDEKMSTLLTPTALAIEGGYQGALSQRAGSPFKTPIDEYRTWKIPASAEGSDSVTAQFSVSTKAPADMPPGIYRFRIDFGAIANKKTINLNAQSFGIRPFSADENTESYLYSPPLLANGVSQSGQQIDASTIKPRVPMLLLSRYNSNGYAGVIADEDNGRFALSNRNIIPDEVILPLYNDKGGNLVYSLEPTLPADTIDRRANIPWDQGSWSVKVTDPDGNTVDLGTSSFTVKNGAGNTNKKPGISDWKPKAYGRYTVEARGWVTDIWGNRYDGGGTYHFWIAKRMTMATATFQGMPYPVGVTYGRDIAFSPAVPANVEVTATLYPNSKPELARSITYSGKASTAGIFGAAQGLKPFPLDAAGEYHASILATYKDPEGHLWVCAMRHAGVVYSPDAPIIAHGKKVQVDGKLVDTGETHFEGYKETDTGVSHLAHVNFPYQSGDVLLIASENQGSNKIEPVLTYEVKGQNAAYDPKLSSIGVTNLTIKTSNGLSPHLFPEYITDRQYYYGAAPRPGFMSRFIVGESSVRAPYWPTSPNSFGGQIGASANGDQPGDIYRLLGGVVVQSQGQDAAYAGYISSAFILPKGSQNNRIITAGSENMTGSNGSQARLFLVGLRPGSAYEVGTPFAPAAQIDPILPATVKFTLTYPDGRVKTAEGKGDKFGSWSNAEKWTLDIPGIYRYWIEADWQGYKGYMPGLPKDGGEFYVYEKARPSGATGMTLNLPEQSTFSVASGLKITGKTTADVIHYAILTPGAVLTQGDLPVNNGTFTYTFEPSKMHELAPIYDIVNLVNGKPELGKIIHITLFSAEQAPGGETYHDLLRVILRGNTAIVTR
jgi:hypothetical protein